MDTARENAVRDIASSCCDAPDVLGFPVSADSDNGHSGPAPSYTPCPRLAPARERLRCLAPAKTTPPQQRTVCWWSSRTVPRPGVLHGATSAWFSALTAKGICTGHVAQLTRQTRPRHVVSLSVCQRPTASAGWRCTPSRQVARSRETSAWSVSRAATATCTTSVAKRSTSPVLRLLSVFAHPVLHRKRGGEGRFRANRKTLLGLRALNPVTNS